MASRSPLTTTGAAARRGITYKRLKVSADPSRAPARRCRGKRDKLRLGVAVAVEEGDGVDATTRTPDRKARDGEHRVSHQLKVLGLKVKSFLNFGYEFTEGENEVFMELYRVLTQLSLATLLVGVCNFGNTLISIASSAPFRRLQTLLAALAAERTLLPVVGLEVWLQLVNRLVGPLYTIYGSYVLFTMARSFKLIVTTEGKDIDHLLLGVEMVRKSFAGQRGPLVGTALFSVATLVGTVLRLNGVSMWAEAHYLPLLKKALRCAFQFL